ncbi:hypothetical protein GALL_203800 [mine drainage metagenome]|uniref:Uncharacterized protein n=1 Tax=mine drainage metagenome TaxID=410659 RepID=A0A1J5SBL8_9ZZZZ
MQTKHCTCGAEADVRRGTRRTAEGCDEIVYRVTCPVCGQLGPAIPAEGKDEATAIAEAIAAWNDMIARRRPLED